MNEDTFPREVVPSPRLVLRPFEPGDAADVHEAWQDERFVQSAPLGYPYAGADLQTAVVWCTTGIEQRRLDGKGAGFAAVPRGGGRLVGHVSLFGADWSAKSAEIHYWTAPWARGHGYAAEAAGAVARWALRVQGFAGAVARWALRVQGFERIALQVDTVNVGSRHAAESAGFRFEGILRSLAPSRTGTRADMAVYSLIRADLQPVAASR